MRNETGKTIENKRRSWEHYIAGWRPFEIARELGLSEAQARRYIRECQDEAQAGRRELAQGYLERELESLDVLEKTLASDMAGEAAQRNAAVRVLLEIKARRAKYLGLDKPAEVKHSLTLEDLVSRSYDTPKSS